ncbi:ornithine decarboxylase, partial [Trichonephila clavata]
LLLRLMVEKSSAKIQMGTKFGCEFTLIEHLLEAATRHNLSVVGVSFHIGTLAQDPNDYALCIEKSLNTFLTGERLGHKMTILDIGGGFPGEADSLEKFKECAPDSLKLCCIAGQTCDPLDIIVESCMLPELDVGDWLMFPNMGAYTNACSTQFNGFEKTGVKYVVSEETLSYLEKFSAGMKLCSFLKGKSVVLEKSNLLTK